MKKSLLAIAVAVLAATAVAGCGKEPLTPANIVKAWAGPGGRSRMADRLNESGALLGLSEKQARSLLAGATVEDRHIDGKNTVVTIFWAESGSGQPDSYWLRAKFVNDRLVATRYGIPG